MAQALSHPQRYRGFVLTAAGLQKLHERIQKLEAQTHLKQSSRSIAERVQLSDPNGIHPITVRKILHGKSGVDKRSIQLVFQVLQLQLVEGDYAHAGLCQQPVEILAEAPDNGFGDQLETAALPQNQDVRQDRYQDKHQDKHQDWSKTANQLDCCGRRHELNQLRQAITDGRSRLVQVLGLPGVGKTALVTLLERTIGSEFELVIWQSFHHAPSIQTVLANVLRLLTRQSRVELPTQVEDLTGLLIEQLQNHRCLLVFDHFNSILCGKQYAGYYRAGYEFYSELLQVIVEVPHQSCLVITSREQPRMAEAGADQQIQVLQLGGLPAAACQQMVKAACELTGTREDWQLLTERCNGNPSLLKIASSYIKNYFDSRIFDYLEYLEPGQLTLSEFRDLLDHQFDRLSPVEQELVYCLTAYQKPVSASKLRDDIAPSVSHQHLLEGLDSLGRRSLLHRRGSEFSLDPMMKAYVNELFAKHQNSSSPKPKLKIVYNPNAL